MANWKALYTTGGLCDRVTNSLMRAVLNTAMGGARLRTATTGIPWEPLFGMIVLRSEKSSSFFSQSTHINSLLG